MDSYETLATVRQGEIHLSGLPFAQGAEVAVTILLKSPSGAAPAELEEERLAAARGRMQELFASVKGFRMTPKFRREELYDC